MEQGTEQLSDRHHKDIFTKKDQKRGNTVDVILDEAANKGYRQMDQPELWTQGEPLSLITESVFARYISSLKDQRVAASKVLSGRRLNQLVTKRNSLKVRRALYWVKSSLTHPSFLSVARAASAKLLGSELR